MLQHLTLLNLRMIHSHPKIFINARMKQLLMSLIVSILLLMIYPIPMFAQEAIHCLDLENPDFSEFDAFDKDVDNMKVVAIGEKHYIKANSTIQAELWMHLNKQFGIRHLLIEFGRSEAYLYNQYLKTGDVKYLQKTTFGVGDFKEFFEDWKKLYQYNLELKPDKKLVVHGLDFEREPALSVSLHELLSQLPRNEELDALLSDIQTRIDTVQIVRKNDDYIDFLKRSIEELSLPNNHQKIIIDDIINNVSFLSKMSSRDKNMAEAFIAIDTLNEAYLGQFGLAHTWMNVPQGFTRVLDDTEAYKGKVLVVNMFDIKSTSEAHYQYNELSNCEVFFYKFDPSGNERDRLKDWGHWTLFLKDQPRYPTLYGSSNSN